MFQDATAKKHWKIAILTLQKWIQACPENANSRKLHLAKLLVALKKPKNAMTALSAVDRENLDDKQTKQFNDLVRQARDTAEN